MGAPAPRARGAPGGCFFLPGPLGSPAPTVAGAAPQRRRARVEAREERHGDEDRDSEVDAGILTAALEAGAVWTDEGVVGAKEADVEQAAKAEAEVEARAEAEAKAAAEAEARAKADTYAKAAAEAEEVAEAGVKAKAEAEAKVGAIAEQAAAAEAAPSKAARGPPVRLRAEGPNGRQRLERAQALAKDDDRVRELLRDPGLEGLTKTVLDGLKTAAQQEAAIGAELFYGGLTQLFGPPGLGPAWRHFVVDPMNDDEFPERDGFKETRTDKCCEAKCLGAFAEKAQAKNAELQGAGAGTDMLEVEEIAGGLCAGPLPEKYNSFLRAASGCPFLKSKFADLCKRNTSTTITHCINSCVIQVSKLTK
ncbi:unnamed protein product, partial [Prorocentrum cordatum]